MESFKILSISKTTGSVPLSSKDSTEVWYVFTLMYGHESFQLQKTTEDLKAMIASTNEVFPLLALESQSVYHESSKSFLLEDLKAYFNKVFQMMYDESLKSTTTTTAGSNTTLSVNIGSISSTNSSSSRGILAYPKILAHIDPTLINSTLIRTSLLLQQNKIRVLTDQVEKLQNRLSTTEGLIAQCKQIADSLATTRANTTTSATTPKTTDSEVVRVDTVDELETPGGVGTGSFSERDSDNELTPGFNSKSIPADSGELIKYEEEVEEIDSSEDDEEGDRAIVSSLNPESVEQVVQYFRANLPSLLYFAGIVDILLEKTKPKTQEMNHRIAIIDYLKSQIRLSLSCSLFVTDLEEIGSPTFGEKKIVLTLLIGKSYQASWDSILLEHLQYLSETGGYQNQRQVKIIRKSSSSALDPNNSSSFVISDDYGDFEVPAGNNNLSDHDIPTSFRIKQIALHNNDPTSSYPYLTCRINNRPVEIRTDPTIDLCFLGLLEEISTLIGRDDLFKKSFSLISSFLFNEQTELFMKNSSNGVPTTASTSNESEKGLKSHKQPIIPNTILWIMVTSIFNKYFSYIESPIQALILFFIEFMTYDPLHTVITLYGVLEYRQVNNPASSNGGLSAGSSSSSLQTIFLGKANYLIKPKLLEKYWNAVNVEEVNVNSEIFNSTLITNPLVNRKFQSNLIAFYTYHPNANAFYAIHPFSYQVLQSEPIPLNTTNSQIYEIFQFGLMKFNHLMETMSTIPREQITETLVYETFMEHIFPKVQKKLFKLDSKPTTPAKIALEDACYVKPDKYMDAIYYCNFILKSLITEPAILYACIEMIDMKGTLPVGEIGKVVTLHSNIAQLSLHLKEKFGGLKKFLEKFPGIFVFGNDHQYNPHVFLRERLSIEHQRMIYRGVLPMQIILQYKKAKNNRKATKRVVVGISGASLNEKSFNSSNPENDTISVGSSNFGLTASLTGAAPAANISPQAMPAPYFAQSAALASNNAIPPQQEFSSYSGSVRLGAVGSLEVVPPGIFKPSQNLDFPPTAALASQFQGGYTYNNSNAAPAAYPSRAPDLSTYGDRGSFTHSNLQSEGRYSTYSSQPTSYSFNYDSTRNVRQGNASYNFPSGANYTENLTHSGVSQANYSSFNGLNLGGPSPHAEEMSQYPHSTYSSAMPSNTASQNKFNPYR